jgi:GAF domain-containing protein
MMLTQTAANPERDFAQLFAHLGRDLVQGHGCLDDVLSVLTHRAVEIVGHAQHAAITRAVRRGFETVAATSAVPFEVDRIQYELGTGPCVDAITDEGNGTYRTGNLPAEPRWGALGHIAGETTDVRSLLSIRFYLGDEDDLIASLNLYSSARDAFDDSDETLATMLATHGALAVRATRLHEQVGHLNIALRSSRRIGAAVGVLMATYKLTDEQAFGLLRVASQGANRKLAVIADEVVRTGAIELPPLRKRR